MGRIVWRYSIGGKKKKKKKKNNRPMQIRIYKISPNIVSNCFNDLQHGWPRKRGP